MQALKPISPEGFIVDDSQLHADSFAEINEIQTPPPKQHFSTRSLVQADRTYCPHTLPTNTFTSSSDAPTQTQPQAIKHRARSNGLKRRRSEENSREGTGTSESPTKEAIRPSLRDRHSLHLDKLPNDFFVNKSTPESPLFFSRSSRKGPAPPPCFLSSDAVNKMMNRAREESGGITTLKLARGSLSNTVSPLRGATPGSAALSPDPRSKNTGLQLLGGVGITEFLEYDERPTFILDVGNPANFSPGTFQIIYANASLRAHEALLEVVKGRADLASPGVVVTNEFPEFKNWALSFVHNHEALDVTLPSFSYAGWTWSCRTLKKRLRVISASGSIGVAPSVSSNPGTTSSSLTERLRGSTSALNNISNLSQPALNEHPEEPSDYFGNIAEAQVKADTSLEISPESAISPGPLQMRSPPSKRRVSPTQAMMATQKGAFSSTKDMIMEAPLECPSFDWTRIPLSAALPRHVQFARSVDWGKTALGPIENWSYDLRAMCNLIMASPMPCCLYWGTEYVAIYNEAFIMLAGQKHPALMGSRYKDAWAEIWDELEEVLESARLAAQSTCKEDDCLFIKRHGYLEECYFSWSIIPIIGQDGTVAGLYNPAFEKTRRKIAERRMLMLREVGEKTSAARDIKAFWGQVIKGLEYNEFDIPFVVLYSCHDEDSDMSSMTSGSLSQGQMCNLEGTIGVPQDHPPAIISLDLKSSDEGWAPYLRETAAINKPILLTIDAGTLSSKMVEGLHNRGWGDQCRAAIVVPIHPTTGDTILGYLIMGVNTRRSYDDDYSLFIQLLSRQLANSTASVVLFETEIKRGEKAARLAALDRQELSKQLEVRTQQAVESETKFTRMAEFAAVGLFIANPSGDITYCNETFWSTSRHPRTADSADTWMESVKEEDREGVAEVWHKLVKEKTAVTHEFRFKAKWQDRDGHSADTWVLFSAYPERDASGELKSIFGCLTDISAVKWAEDIQKRRMEEAIENKRAQENFIDMTSHEMRNPLSAILQSADEIIASLNPLREGAKSEEEAELIYSCIDAANTISLCGAHQKRIVDDILTLSKLDSALLMVTPVLCQPVSIVQRALKMFEGELETKDIALGFQIEKSYMDLDVDWVKLDPSRLLQVLINLTTNAIKFTFPRDIRSITVRVGASVVKPSKLADSSVNYFPSRDTKRSENVFADKDWGNGEEIYLKFAVQDTGTGLDEDEKKLLFQRFSQASPRTHVTYGGSGLGLFISRELTELQGGEIGVSSEKDVGSTFAFYIKARRDDSVPKDTPIATSITTLRKKSPDSSVITLESKKNSNGKPISRSNTAPRRPSLAPSSPSLQPQPPPHSQIRVLIVEDNLVNQSVLRRSLAKAGFETEVANHGGEALSVLQSSRFWTGKEESGLDLSIILMDLEMPIMDGLTCARRIRELETEGLVKSHVPIIAVTANARMEQIQSALGSGMDDVVSKPFRVPELTPKIEQLVARSSKGDWEIKVVKEDKCS